MKLRARWLSSQILLLVIVGWVSGLAVIHHLWLVPTIKKQVARQESGIAVRWVEQSLSGLANERKALANWSRNWIRAMAPRQLLDPQGADGLGPEVTENLGPVGLVVCDLDRHVLRTAGWVTETSHLRPKPAWTPGQDLSGGPLFPPDWVAPRLTGLVATTGRICLFAREPIGSKADVKGYALFIRPIDWPMIQALNSVAGVDIMVADSLRPDSHGGDMEHVRHWSSGHGTLAADVNLKDTLGRPIGRLEVAGSVTDLGDSADKVRSAYLVQLMWLIISALVTFGVVYLLFIRPLAILVRRLGDSEVTSKRDGLPHGLFAETGIVARQFSSVLDRIVVLSETDPLTGLTNRRQFQIILDHEFHRSKRHNQSLAVLMVDIDHFKQVNDRYGHLAGDEVLKFVAANLKAVCRRSDLSARFGGEEFAMVLPNTTMEQAAVFGERLRRKLDGHEVEVEGQQISVTLSVGVSAMPEIPCDHSDRLIDSADQALYRAKRTGRNRTVLASLPDESPDEGETAPAARVNPA